MPRLLSNIGKSIFYKRSLSNVLSNLKVADADVRNTVRNSNLLNLRTKWINFASCESKVVPETKNNLFILLRIITTIYKDIHSNLNDHKDQLDEIVENGTRLGDTLRDYYLRQSAYYSDMYVACSSTFLL